MTLTDMLGGVRPHRGKHRRPPVTDDYQSVLGDAVRPGDVLWRDGICEPWPRGTVVAVIRTPAGPDFELTDGMTAHAEHSEYVLISRRKDLP